MSGCSFKLSQDLKDGRAMTMDIKARYLMVGILLITLSMVAFQASLQAQDAPEPEVTEDSCITIIEAGMKSQDDAAPMATDAPALDACLESLSTTVLDTATLSIAATNELGASDATETVSPAVAQEDSIYIPITVIHSNIFADAGRVWVTWHDSTTGALTVGLRAYNQRLSYYNMGLDITIPDDVVNIAIRIETTQDRSSDNWEFDPTCAFAFEEASEGFSINIDDDNMCIGQIESA
jgi:hypothetical protein